jgi:hypothetical protein
MKSVEVFCYALALKGASRKSELLGLLPENERTAIDNAFREVQELPENEIRLRWKRERLKDLVEQRGRVKSQLGRSVERVSPRLQAWLARPFREGI